MAYMRLGDLLVSSGVITNEQLEKALEMQKETKERLGDVLIRAGFITEQQLIEALVGQLGRAPLLPHRNQLVDGAEYAAHQDGAGNHHPGRNLPLHRQQGAEPKHQRLQSQAHAF